MLAELSANQIGGGAFRDGGFFCTQFPPLQMFRQSQLGSLSEELSCPVCLDWLRAPVTLPCGHVYCQGCIETAWGSMDVPPACPECREPCPERRYAPCRLLGKLIDQEDLTSGAVAQLETSLAQLLQLKREDEERVWNHQAMVLSLGEHIATEFRKLQDWLAAREEEWQARLRQVGTGQLQALERNLQELEGKCQAAQGMLAESQAHLPQREPAEFLTDINSFLAWAKKHLATSRRPNTGSMAQTLGQFKGLVQYTAWKDMKSILSVDLPRVTLDAATAHPCLVLSEDGTRVRDSHLRRPLPDTPARFDFCVAVLGARAFASGQHYWEVEVGEKPAWTLGVVHASISRKGKIHASPSKGFWVIRLRGGAELMAKDTPPVVLHPQTLPHRIGVYLDYEGGQVSFYNARGMAHLYSFTARFAERVYPYFCPGLYDSGGNATPLKICPLP
ncbi:E3 ubiquitin-protein ligase TRIM69-like [Carettochelys insculpta]|uniref:E3 ubiquitin-protein ligase TRIM69-like n=1 Tax=Carettochelys insculpta TaxID=44489 RepID=UPI003EBD99DF